MREMDFVDECYADKDLSLLKKLTLVIPTYNRNYYLSRCLWYHAHFPFGEIIVADSSPEEKKVVNRETVQKIREMFGANIRYLEYEPETEKYGGDIYRKWGDAVQHVETEYSQIVTDKEFLIPTAIHNIIIELSGNPEYIAGYGKEYALTANADNTDCFLISRHPKRSSETSDRAEERFDHSLVYIPGFTNSLLLATSNTNVLKEIYTLYFDHNIQDIRYGEVFLGYAGHIFGKSISIENPTYRIRDETYIRKDRAEQRGRFWCKSPESSTSRYPTFKEYQKCNVAEKLYQPLESALQEAFLTKTELTDKEISQYLLKRKQPLYTVLTSISPQENIMNYFSFAAPLWYHLPLSIKKRIQKIGYRGFHVRLPIERTGEIHISPQTPEERIVSQIVVETLHFHTTDSPIKMEVK